MMHFHLSPDAAPPVVLRSPSGPAATGAGGCASTIPERIDAYIAEARALANLAAETSQRQAALSECIFAIIEDLPAPLPDPAHRAHIRAIRASTDAIIRRSPIDALCVALTEFRDELNATP